MEKTLNSFNEIYKGSGMEYPIDMVINFLEKRYSMPDYNTRKAVKALDIGFGPGSNLKALLDYGFLTYGIDYSEICVNQVKEKYSYYKNMAVGGGIIRGDFLYHKFKEKFGVILCTGSIFLNPIDEIKKMLDLIYEILDSSNGYALINFYSGDVDEFCYAPLFDNKLKIQWLTFSTMKKLLEEAGFIISNIEYTSYHKITLQKEYKRYWFEVTK